MGRDDNLGPRLQKRPDQFALAMDVDILPPIRLVNLAGCVGDLAGHQEQVLPHAPRDARALGLGRFGKGDPQVVVNQLVPQANHIAHQPGQPAADGMARLDADRQDQRHGHPNRQVFGPMAQRDERHSVS
jgi:hypothetical protein